jgi:peroxiredoxin Q/BCP
MSAEGADATMLVEGSRAPDFDLEADDGSRVKLRDLAGRKVVLYFYPKDDTPGCTTQACDFRDAAPRFLGMDAEIFGVSPDSVESHVKFKTKFGLTFPLLSDPDRAVSEAYGVWRKKSLYGRTFFGVERSTFLIDRRGVVVRVWRKVRVKGHAEEVASAVATLE